MSRAEIIHKNFQRRLLASDFPATITLKNRQDVELADWEIVDLFESQVISRHLDILSRRLRANNESFYTIGSSGHEANAVLGKVLRYTDMAFLHYRSCALLVQRSKQLAGETVVYDSLLSFTASADDPISGGRHKVLGSKTLSIPPQTSTIASHLPKAMGAAYSIDLAKRVSNADKQMLPDSIVLCNFGDASANHSTALGAINAAAWASFQNVPMPIVFVCEDNGIGISVATPNGWIKQKFINHPGIKYFECNGLDLLDTFQTANEAQNYARRFRRPVFLHIQLIRLMGHAGSDLESAYRDINSIEKIEAEDPLLYSASILVKNAIMSATQVHKLYTDIESRLERVAQKVIMRDKLKTAAQVMSTIVPGQSNKPDFPLIEASEREQVFAREKRLLTQPQNMARLINITLVDIMLQYKNTIVCGEDIGNKGGVYSVTTGLKQKFGSARVLDTLLDEQSILGLAIGLAHNGFLPIPEIQFLAYVHNAEDQIRGEAATLPFFSAGQYSNAMVIRIAGLAYQKGFGGHFHNDNSLTVFRDIPGIIVACPSNGADAVAMLRQCVYLAHRHQRLVIFIEPIALYATKDLHQKDDGLWASIYQAPAVAQTIELGQIGIKGDGKDIAIISYANGYYLSTQAAKILAEQYNIKVTLVDLRWLCPVNGEALLAAVAACNTLLVVDECRQTGSISEELFTLFVENTITVPYARINAQDSFIPLGDAANLLLPNVERIVKCAINLCSFTNKSELTSDQI